MADTAAQLETGQTTEIDHDGGGKQPALPARKASRANRGANKFPIRDTVRKGWTGELAGQPGLNNNGCPEDISATKCMQQRPPAKATMEADHLTHVT